MKTKALRLLPLVATALAVVVVHRWVAAELSLLTELVLVVVVGGGTFVTAQQVVHRRLGPP
jgi:hypothetical protein